MCLDDYIPGESMCRVILEFVDSLDLAEMGFKYSITKSTGRPPYNAANLLMLYIYGYLNRIRSLRRLEAETHRNIEVMWLMEKVTPDDKTISNFRKDNAKVLKKVFRRFSLWCNEQGLYGKELVAVDGSKFRADANRKSIHTLKNTQTKFTEVEKKISEYMNELEKNDMVEAKESKLNSERISGALKYLNDKKEELQSWLKKIEENDGKEISTEDPDAAIMHTNGDGRRLDACYNVQSVADSKHNLIVDFDVTTSPDDKGALVTMTESAKEIMCVDTISATGDKGYYDGEDIERCESANTTCYIPHMPTGRGVPDAEYVLKKFKYDAGNDRYMCPQGQFLKYNGTKKRKDGKVNRIYKNAPICQNCQTREKCTKNKYGCEIARTPHQDALDTVDARMRMSQGREISRKRSSIVEHPFGTIKAIWGYKQFLCKGQEKVAGEMSLAFLAYNLRRVFNIFKQNEKNLIEAMA